MYINTDQRLYVQDCGTGYSCLGFDVVEHRRQALAGWLGKEAPELPCGTEAHWHDYQALMCEARTYCVVHNVRCPIELTPALIGLEGQRVEVTYPDGTRERFWVGKSTGWMPIHLAIKTRRSTGGCQVYWPVGTTVRRIR